MFFNDGVNSELFIMSKQYYVLVTWHMEFLNP